MDVNGQFHAPAALLQEKFRAVSAGEEPGWISESV
jgi:hypothetical protein